MTPPEYAVRFSQAAYILERTPKALRWLLRHYSDGSPPREWREFGVADLLILGLAIRLMDYGCPAPEALPIAADVIGRYPEGEFEDWDSAALAMRHDILIVERTGERWHFHLYHPAVDLPDDMLPDLERDAPTGMFIRMGALARDLLWRDGAYRGLSKAIEAHKRKRGEI